MFHGDKKPKQTRSRHGLCVVKARVKVRGLGAIDLRTAAARGLVAWRNDLIAALGGAETISAQRLALIDMTVRTRLFIDHLDAFLVEQPSLVNKRRKSMIPALRERQALVDSLSRLLSQLGLERVAKPVPSLADYVAGKEPNP
jgi:hypothetical protein